MANNNPQTYNDGEGVTTVVWMDADFAPVEPGSDDAAYVKMIASTGEMSFYHVNQERSLGGPGSGNFGHAGRPGQVGGSALSEQEKHDRFIAVNGYIHGNFQSLNKALRKKEEKNLSDELRYHIATLDKAMEPLPQDETMHRIVRETAIARVEPGDIFEDLGYISTTRNDGMLPVIKNDLGYTSLASLAHVVIEVPKGTNHIDVNKNMGEHPYGNQYNHQQEIILPRGTQFEVIRKSEEEEAGKMRPVLHVRVHRG